MNCAILRRSLLKIGQLSSSALIEPCAGYQKIDDLIYASDFKDSKFPAVTNSGIDNAAICGQGATTGDRLKITISGNNNIVFLGPFCQYATGQILISGNDSAFIFGAFSTTSDMTVQVTGNNGAVSIGDHCMFSNRVIVSNTDGHAIYDKTTRQRINNNSNVKVGDHVWIGRDVRITKGCQIGNDAIVGQGSLIRGTCAGGSIYVGNPAKPIKDNVTWSRMYCDNLDEMENSIRHKKYIAKISNLEKRIHELNAISNQAIASENN